MSSQCPQELLRFGIHVDRFVRPRHANPVYLLTHTHSDHTAHLDSSFRHGPVYCSTSAPTWRADLKYVLRPLRAETWHRIRSDVRVWLWNTHHSWDSVGFVVEVSVSPSDVRKYIWTGDFLYLPSLDRAKLQAHRPYYAGVLDGTLLSVRRPLPDPWQALKLVISCLRSKRFPVLYDPLLASAHIVDALRVPVAVRGQRVPPWLRARWNAVRPQLTVVVDSPPPSGALRLSVLWFTCHKSQPTDRPVYDPQTDLWRLCMPWHAPAENIATLWQDLDIPLARQYICSRLAQENCYTKPRPRP